MHTFSSFLPWLLFSPCSVIPIYFMLFFFFSGVMLGIFECVLLVSGGWKIYVVREKQNLLRWEITKGVQYCVMCSPALRISSLPCQLKKNFLSTFSCVFCFCGEGTTLVQSISGRLLFFFFSRM
uniref:Uncharacterized protein n=1 Tax=Ixodes scapularis TaxID=6945 RepID=A0A4D5RX39_IXOSC